MWGPELALWHPCKTLSVVAHAWVINASLSLSGQPQILVGYSLWHMVPKEWYLKLISVFYMQAYTCGPVMHEHICTHTHTCTYTQIKYK